LFCCSKKKKATLLSPFFCIAEGNGSLLSSPFVLVLMQQRKRR
jgi:hypothetical protein